MSSKEKILMAVLMIAAVVSVLCALAPGITGYVNQWIYDVRKVGDATNYESLKRVEDTCRAMIASYEADKLTYEQYRNSDNPEQRSWAAQAMMRANKTATMYNEYVLQNSFGWAGNVPNDIRLELDVILEEN